MSFKNVQNSHSESVFINVDHFAEDVIFHGTEDLSGPCLVQLDEPIRDIDGDQQTEFSGQLTIPISKSEVLQLGEGNPVLVCTLRSEVWDITDVGPEINGTYIIGIRRKTSETEHSNAFDMNRSQDIYDN